MKRKNELRNLILSVLVGSSSMLGLAQSQNEVSNLDVTIVEVSPAPAVPVPTTVQRNAAPTPAVKKIQNAPVTLPEVATTVGSLIPQDEVFSVDTIAVSELRRSQRSDLFDTVSRLAGVSLSRNGGEGSVSSLFVRGQESDHILVLLNGRRLPPGLGGQFQLEFLDVSTLESVQLQRGAVSSVHGSDALAGVLELRSTDARFVETNGLSLFSEAGSFSSLNSGGTATFRDEAWGGVLDVTRRSTDTHRPNSDFENVTIRGNLAYDIADGVWFDVLGSFQDGQVGVAGNENGGFSGPFPTSELNENTSALFSPRLTIERDNWDLSSYYSYTQNELTATGSQGNDNFLDQNSHEFQTVLTIRPNDDLALSVGGAYNNLEFDRVPITNPFGFNNPAGFNFGYTSVFGEINVNLPEDVKLQASYRYEEHDSFDSVGTYSVAVNKAVKQTGTTFFGKVGTGYKSPSGQEFAFLDPSVNPTTLLPEENFTWEVGIKQNLFNPDSHLTVTYFNSDLENLATSNFNFATFTLLPAVTQAETSGIEVELASEINKNLGGYLNYTYTDSEFISGQTFGASPGNRLARRPLHTLNAGLHYTNDSWTVGAELQGAFNRFDGQSTIIDDYVTARFFGAYKVNDRLELNARVENAFDREYEYTSGFSAPGAAVYGGLQINFGK